jgi:hypothetical protein
VSGAPNRSNPYVRRLADRAVRLPRRQPGGKEDMMEPVLADAPFEESEFDLDVRLEAVRQVSDEKTPPEPPDYSECMGSCTCQQ